MASLQAQRIENGQITLVRHDGVEFTMSKAQFQNRAAAIGLAAARDELRTNLAAFLDIPLAEFNARHLLDASQAAGIRNFTMSW